MIQRSKIREKMMRLDKFLSKAADLSRSDAKSILRCGEIVVNGHLIKDGSFQIDEAVDCVQWANKILSVATGYRYILLYKPDGFECTLKPNKYPIVTDLVAVPQVNQLRMAGRLDVETTGALLVSDDGAWLHRVTSPKRHQPKRYELTLARPMTQDEQDCAIKQVANGILLAGDVQKTRTAKLTFTSDVHAVLMLTEGKYHQVKRMMGHFGNQVIQLHRASIGNITLDGLKMGESRFLTHDEIQQF